MADNHDNHHGTYYVPEQSIWPIIGAIGLFFFAIGSLNFGDLWGAISFYLGAAILAVMLFGWLKNVVQESRFGYYDAQMGRTFRWGMFWFLFCEAFFFGTPLAALLYTRFSTMPWIAGSGGGGSLLTHYVLWPNFQNVWPLLKNPNPFAFPAPKQAPSWEIPFLNSLILLASAITASFSLWIFKKGYQATALIALLATIILGSIFLSSQIRFIFMLMESYGLTTSSGIYGSLLFMLYGFHSIHVIACLFILAVVFLLLIKKHFTPTQTFGFSAAIWFWNFVTLVWFIIYTCIYL